MVHLMNSDNLRPESEKPSRNKLSVKLEIEDSLDEEHGPLNKRSKLSPSFQKQWSTVSSTFSISPSQYNPLDEPSPLGLQLKKSPSFLDLIQMRLSQGNASALNVGHGGNPELEKKNLKGTPVSGISDKLKASNFPASLLRIGTWECVSRYEGDLVAKCYFAKHKLVWEVLEAGLKSKIEIQWSDITALRATCPDNEPGTLDIVLARQPLFFRETNPQPRKHTLWQATSDFTGGQASLHRQHFLQCPQGLLNKHFEKLIQCDLRLNMLSQQPQMVLESPYFEPRVSVFEESEESKCHGFDSLSSDYVSSFSGFQDAPSPSTGQTSSSKSELRDPVSKGTGDQPRETPSPSSVMDTHVIEGKGSNEAVEAKLLSHCDQFKVPGLHPSMSMSDFVTHLGQCIAEQMTDGSGEAVRNKEILEEIAQHLLGDSQLTATSDEKSLMSRVNSLCCLLQKDPQGNNKPGSDDGKDGQFRAISESTRENNNKFGNDFPVPEKESNDISGCKQVPAISRKDSLGDLLLNLPRIASLPQFLFNIAEDDNQAR